MNRRLQTGLFLLVAAVAGYAGYYFSQSGPQSPAAQAAAAKLMRGSLADLSGKSQPLSQWHGKVMVVNYWATWCPPCREEIPALKKVYEKYRANGVEIVGIALDNASKVRQYAADMTIDYNLLIGGPETLALSSDLGNPAGVLPFTAVLDRTGKLAYTHAGAMTEAALDAVLKPLL